MAKKRKIEGEDEACGKGYVTRIPLAFLRDRRLTEGARILGIYMTRYVGMNEGKIYPSQGNLAEELEVDVRVP